MNGYDPESLAEVWRNMRKTSPSGHPKNLPIGVDGMRVENFERNLTKQIHEISRRISRHAEDGLPSYDFAALLCFEQLKSSVGFRKIHVPRLRDQLVLRAMHGDLVHTAEKQGLRLSQPSPIPLVKAFRNALVKFSDPWILRTDVHSFFDSVPRDKVMVDATNLGISGTTRGLLTKWSASLRARMPGKLQAMKDVQVAGLPQGLSLSSSLAELWANKIDRAVDDRFHYFRYVDDIVVICESRSSAKAALGWLGSTLSDLDLSLSQAKTEISSIHRGVSWLGLIHFKENIHVDRQRLERWLRRFETIRRRAAENFRACLDDGARESVLNQFHREIRDEINGRTSSRPAWYTLSEDAGEWKEMDRAIHAMIRSFHRQAGVQPPSSRQLPSIHRALLARKSRKKLSVPSNADQGPCAIFSQVENQQPNKGT